LNNRCMKANHTTIRNTYTYRRYNLSYECQVDNLAIDMALLIEGDGNHTLREVHH